MSSKKSVEVSEGGPVKGLRTSNKDVAALVAFDLVEESWNG
jgi:hypothetical protein